ncbi:NADH-ubiquinone oxidoreductase [Methanofollis aquaemaris]|uniref:NADH-ubiquinone oxidoreductase n=1 Tax=Methanofollis aquaemaris TaxID=126734 RepID=A0A8A3S4G4_9EURY|nr:NADH-quinone oxidoreductase subunit H [Methanofollis aquaemaris]QSZ66504.1 NADH-ubiquinone oxidoreductase [Methanofollis aquaemaris]
MIGYLILAVFIGLLYMGIHRKVIARVQGRPGPPIWQELLHTLKFSFKQTWIPKTASPAIFVGIVFVAIGIWTTALWVVISGGSLLIIFGLYICYKMVEHGVGLSPGSPYAKFGGVRSVISAASEIPLLLSVGVLYFFTGSLMIGDIAAFQAEHGPLLVTAAPAALALYVVILSKMHYSPFSIVESKEIVSGYKTEHFGVWRAGLEAADGIKTFVLLYLFVLLFVGPLPLVLMLLAMLVLMLTLSFVCALTPMLAPFDSVTVQTGLIAVVLAWTALLVVVL